MPLLPESLAHDALDRVAGDRPRGKPLRHDHAKPGSGRGGVTRARGAPWRTHRQQRPPGQLPALECKTEFGGPMQTRRSGERSSHGRLSTLCHRGWREVAPRGGYLDSQTLAAFGTARVEYGATGAGLHAHTKTMSALAAGDGGLIGAFHRCLISTWDSRAALASEAVNGRANRSARQSEPKLLKAVHFIKFLENSQIAV